MIVRVCFVSRSRVTVAVYRKNTTVTVYCMLFFCLWRPCVERLALFHTRNVCRFVVRASGTH